MRKEIQLYEYQKDMLRQIEDAFVTHGSMEALLTQCGLMPEQIAARIVRALKE